MTDVLTSTSPSRTARDPRRAVLLFARRPREEARCKRLVGGKRLFQLGRDRVLTAAAQLPAVTPVYLGDPGDAKLPEGTRVLAQRGGDFGTRLALGVEDAFALGFDEIVVVGLDAPLLSSAHLAAAFRALDQSPVVLGPAADGGVYLLGLRVDTDRCGLWKDVRWQTRGVLRQLRRNALLRAAVQSAGPTPVHVLSQVLTDIDQLDDARHLERIARHDVELLGVLQLLLLPSWQLATSHSVPTSRRSLSPISRRGPPARAA